MTIPLETLRNLQSPFYRVAVKALIFDEQKRLLVVINKDHEAELPGGGWEHDESLEECIRREVVEELNAELATISPVQFVFPGESDQGWRVLRVVVRAQLAGDTFAPGDDMIDARFVTKDELLALDFAIPDAPIKDFTEQIWRS